MGNGITFTFHQTFFAISYRHHKIIKRLVRDREARTVNNDRDVDFICAKNAAIQRSVMFS